MIRSSKITRANCHSIFVSKMYLARWNVLGTVLQCDRPLSATEEVVMRLYGGFSSIFLGNLVFPLFTSNVQCREYCCLQASRYNSPWVASGMSTRSLLRQVWVKPVQAGFYVLLGKSNQWGTACSSRPGNVQGNHYIYLVFKFSQLILCVEWGGTKWFLNGFSNSIWYCTALIEPRGLFHVDSK